LRPVVLSGTKSWKWSDFSSVLISYHRTCSHTCSRDYFLHYRVIDKWICPTCFPLYSTLTIVPPCSLTTLILSALYHINRLYILRFSAHLPFIHRSKRNGSARKYGRAAQETRQILCTIPEHPACSFGLP
jgi:hypothetical protein